MKIPTIEVTVPITADNLPRGPKWEEDGSCWEAIKCNQDTQGCEWRWQPKNWKAFAKDGPEGEMTDFVPSAFAVGEPIDPQGRARRAQVGRSEGLGTGKSSNAEAPSNRPTPGRRHRQMTDIAALPTHAPEPREEG